MLKLIDPAARSLAAATFITALLLVGPAQAGQSPDPSGAASATLLAQGDAAPAPATKKSPMAEAEARIKQLRVQLKITPAQKSQWHDVAQAMRENAKDMQAIIAERHKKTGQMTAVDDLRSYQEAAETHVQGLQRLIPAFQALYDTMSPEQKKNADAVFGHVQRHGAGHA
jgi:hypothetical protein